MPGPIRIGTQGWNYDAWVGPFYPSGTRPSEFLTVYGLLLFPPAQQYGSASVSPR